MPVHQALCLQSLTGAALFGLSTWASGVGLAPPLTAPFVLGTGWLVLVATFATYSVYYTSLRLFPVARVSAAIYLSPPLTMALAWALFDEPLSPAIFAGLAVTLLGVALTLRG